MSRKISSEGRQIIQQFEGCVLYTYDDQDTAKKKRFIKPGDKIQGVLTIGYGRTVGVVPGMRCTPDEAEQWFSEDISIYENAIANLVNVFLNDNQFAALVSFIYNIGIAAFKKSTLLRELNKGNYAKVPTELIRWNKDNGKVIPGLANRRAAEAGLWAKESFVASANTVAKPEKPPVVTGEKIAMITTATTSLGALTIFDGSGPVQWALAGILIVVFIVGGYLFFRERRA